MVRDHATIVTVGQRLKGGRDIWGNLSRGPASAKAPGEDKVSMFKSRRTGLKRGRAPHWDHLSSSTMKGAQDGGSDKGRSSRVL